MYELGAVRQGFEVEPGTNLLVTGPPMTGKRALSLDVLAHGSRSGEGSIVVTTKDAGDDVRESLRERLGRESGGPLGIVDCVTKQQGTNPPDSEEIAYASSPDDMTGIGIQLSEFLKTFYEERQVRQNRILLHSLSALLIYSNLQTVFRFLHVFTGRIQSADALGMFVIDEDAHDQKTMSTLQQLFDGQIEVRQSDGGDSEVRVTGVGAESEWQPVQ